MEMPVDNETRVQAVLELGLRPAQNESEPAGGIDGFGDLDKAVFAVLIKGPFDFGWIGGDVPVDQ
jgi:hypothetical protein